MATNAGVLEVVYATVDVGAGGISDAGHHLWDPAANTELDDPLNVTVTGQEDPTYQVEFDSLNGDRFHVVNVADGTDVGAGTDIGEIEVRVEGRR